MPNRSYDEVLFEELQDPELAAGYLSDALRDESLDLLLIALRNVAQARGGLGALSSETDLNRQALYRMLSEDGNPTLANLLKVLAVLGFDIEVRTRAA